MHTNKNDGTAMSSQAPSNASQSPEYTKPTIVSYNQDDLMLNLGPAQAQYSAKPDAGDGGGFI